MVHGYLPLCQLLYAVSRRVSYQKIADIVYTVDESVANGIYNASINDLNFNFDDGTNIILSELPIQITVDHSYSAISGVSEEVKAYKSGDMLYIDSSVTEKIQIYSVNGLLLYDFQKAESKLSYPVNKMPATVLIVKGSSGWVKKVVQ